MPRLALANFCCDPCAEPLLTLRNACGNCRGSISEASLSHDITAYCGADPPTPSEADTFSFRRLSANDAVSQYSGVTLSEILLFENPLLSGSVAGVGTAALVLGHFLLSGRHSYTLLTAASYTLLALLGTNFLRRLISRAWTGEIRHSALVSNLSLLASAAVAQVAEVYDAYLTCRDPVVALRVACALWGLALVGRWLSIWTTLSVVFLGAFALPVQYRRHEAEVQRALLTSRTAVAVSAGGWGGPAQLRVRWRHTSLATTPRRWRRASETCRCPAPTH